jgi:hypothetical protein
LVWRVVHRDGQPGLSMFGIWRRASSVNEAAGGLRHFQ